MRFTWFTDMFQSFLLLYSFFSFFEIDLIFKVYDCRRWVPEDRDLSIHSCTRVSVCAFTWIPVCICCGQIILPSETACYCSCECNLTDFFFLEFFLDILRVSETMEKEKNFQ